MVSLKLAGNRLVLLTRPRCAEEAIDLVKDILHGDIGKRCSADLTAPWKEVALEAEDINGRVGSRLCAAVRVKGDGGGLGISTGRVRCVGSVVVNGGHVRVVGKKRVNCNGAQVHRQLWRRAWTS